MTTAFEEDAAERRRVEVLRVAESLAMARVRAGQVAVPRICANEALALIKAVTDVLDADAKAWPR